MSKSSSLWLLAPIFGLASAMTTAPPEKVQLTIGTIHAATLTKSRAPGDTLDAPFLVVSLSGPRAHATMLPDTGQMSIRLNQALGARPLTELNLSPGDSIEVTLSLLESAGVTLSAEARTATLSSKAQKNTERAEQAAQMVAPLVKQGAHWIGSVSLLVTNEAGTIFWRRLDCLKTCTVLSAPPTAGLPAPRTQPAIGVLEFSGNGGLYHLQLSANRTP